MLSFTLLYTNTVWLFARETLKLHSPGEHGGTTELTKERKCWERSVRK